MLHNDINSVKEILRFFYHLLFGLKIHEVSSLLLLSCPFLLTGNGKRSSIFRRAPVGGSPTSAQILDLLILNQLPDERSPPG